MTFEQLCESMGWEKSPFKAWDGPHIFWYEEEVYEDETSGVLMAVDGNLTASGAIAVQTEYKLHTTPRFNKWYCSNGHVWVVVPDIPTAIRDCAMEIEL